MATAEPDTQPEFEPLDPNSLQHLLDGRYAELREQIREVLCRPGPRRSSLCPDRGRDPSAAVKG